MTKLKIGSVKKILKRKHQNDVNDEDIANKPKHNKETVHKTKSVTLHHHHAKPYRKRHIGSFLIFFVVFIIMFITFIQYRSEINASIKSAQDWVAYLFSNNQDYNLSIKSSYGYSISYDQKQFYASAIDDNDGGLYIGHDLTEKRAYGIVRISPSYDNTNYTKGSLTLTYHRGTTYQLDTTPTLSDITNFAFSDVSIDKSLYIQKSSEDAKIDGQIFLKTIWQRVEGETISSKLEKTLVIYSGIVNDHPVTIVVNNGIESDDDTFSSVISSISFGDEEEAFTEPSQEIIAKINNKRSLMDSILVGQIASAEQKNSSPVSSVSNKPTDAQKIAAYYSSAVTKIYNINSMNIYVNNYPFIEDYVQGLSGSGFFVSKDGYLATNGHVASNDPKGLAITYAFSAFVNNDDYSYLDYLISLTTLTDSDIEGLSENEALSVIIDKLYNEIPDSSITTDDSISNLLVCLSDESLDVEAVMESMVYDGEEYNGQSDTIKKAELINANYRALDGIDGFKASDVAIIKIDGNNYPVTSLGDIDNVAIGSDLFVIGFPGLASDNSIVESEQNIATITTGTVSSIKNVLKSDKKVIETDATLGHGNSGGPAFIKDGNVVGIATYAVNGASEGSGNYNYIRDIQDLKDLASDNGIKFDTNSKTQKEWEAGLENFYSAHYSKSLVNFKNVKKLYSYMVDIDKFIEQAEIRIKNGEDIQDFPVTIVLIVGSIALVGVVIFVIIIIRHKKHHNIYKEQVTSGAIQPMAPGSPSQKVTVDVQPFKPFTPVTPNLNTSSTPIVTPNQTEDKTPVKNVMPTPVLTNPEITPAVTPESNTSSPDQVIK